MDNLAVNKRWSEQLDLQEEILFDANDQSLATPIWKNYVENSKIKENHLKKFGKLLNYEEDNPNPKV